jgi:uncharacterized protein DUF4252
MPRTRHVPTAAAALLLAGCGITGNFRNDPGYARFGSPGPLATDRELGISAGPLPLKFMRWVMDDDPEMAPLLEDLRAVRVYTYDVLGDVGKVAPRIQAIQSELLDDGWVALATLRDEGELLSVLLRFDDRGNRRGLAVIAQDQQEVMLVNLIGRDIKFELFNNYMAELNIDAPPVEIDAAALQARRL